ncbi:hypothetical protein [Prosthecobacter sp.]|uniref:hypothetical protein n=1 Tax=Prosthecobacter sp. TaxID=1965333 RepID=UPI002628D4D0|nr:hypothetical protein [Prosthecobacter sp.]
MSALSYGFAGVLGLSESEENEGSRIMTRMHEIEREAETKKAELEKKTEVIVYALYQGEFRFLDAAAAQKDMDVLWYVLMEAKAKHIGSSEIRRDHPDELVSAPLITELNEKIATHVRLKIAAIPGHARVLGNRFERMSQDVGYFFERRKIMRGLQMVGSMEAIQQIGRFLQDKRAPDALAAQLAFEKMTDYLDPAAESRESNASLAAHAMGRVLGEDSPARMYHGKIVVEPEISVVQTWWKSDAAKFYREWNPETGPMMPPTR